MRARARALLIESFGPAPDARALEARIAQAIDHAQPRWWRLAGYGSVAAMLALVVGLGVWFSRPVDAAAFDDSVDNHIACALTLGECVSQNAAEALWRSVLHGGDSDSTGSLLGNLLGAMCGSAALPAHWLAELELADLLERIGADLWTAHFGGAALDRRDYPVG